MGKSVFDIFSEHIFIGDNLFAFDGHLFCLIVICDEGKVILNLLQSIHSAIVVEEASNLFFYIHFISIIMVESNQQSPISYVTRKLL